MRRALIVTITEGVELQPQAAFLSSALRALGFETELLPTDFCTSQDSFQTALRTSNPDAVLFIDGLEWREILVTLSGFAVATIEGPILVVTALPSGANPGGFTERVQFVPNGDLATLGALLGADSSGIALGNLPLDYSLFGGTSLLARAMGCSLFGDVGSVGLVSFRVLATCSTAALSRLEGVVGSLEATGELSDEAALAPLVALGSAVRAVEWWDHVIGPGSNLIERVFRSTGLPQSVRTLPEIAGLWFEDGAQAGVRRLVFDCDAVEGVETWKLRSAPATASEVASAVIETKAAGLETGVLLVIGLPGETAVHTKARCDRLRTAGVDRVRVVPFEPAGGTPAYDWCVGRGMWPPKENRWNRELYQPLEQPEMSEWPRILEEALMLVADVESRSGVSA